jgi:hypothetical protein
MEPDWRRQIDGEMEEINNTPILFHGIRLWWKERKVKYNIGELEAAKAFIAAKSTLMRLNHEVEQLQASIERETESSRRKFQLEMEMMIHASDAAKCQARLIEAATNLGMTVEDASEVNKQRALIDIDVEKHQQLKEIDHVFLVKEINAKIEGALKHQLLSVQQSVFLLGQVNQLKDELYQLRYSGQPLSLIRDKEASFLKVIQGMEGMLGRLLQIDNGQDVERGDKDTILRGFIEPDNPNCEKQASD